MDLKDLQIPSETVRLPHGTSHVDMPVRGLDPTDLAYLLREQRASLEQFYAQAARGELATDDYGALASQILAAAPVLLGSILACGFGQPDPAVAEKMAKLPFTVQLDAIEKIGRLTFAAEGGVKKVLETVITMMSGMNALQDSQIPSLSGRGLSENG